MSGIAGIIHFDGKPVEPGLVKTMTSAMAHRGPDGIHHWVKGSVALGQCMLRTTPESLEETQPLTNEDESLVLVMDGRVDNWEELRRELLARGAVLRNHADAELVLRAYELWGRDCLAQIDGDFALVIWDARRLVAFCARDRMGNKPFNYHWLDKTFVFASELHTILPLPWVREILNEGTVAEFLAAEWYSRDETFWKGILRLMAAHQMVVGAGGPHADLYWAPDLWETLSYKKDEEYIEHYRELFSDVVRRMSRSFRPVACEVSGGLDSSAIFAIAENLSQQLNLPAPGVQGYTLDFHDDPDANELEFSRAVGQHLGRQVREILPTKMPLSWYRTWAHRYREFPGYPNGIMGLGIRAEARAMGSRVLLVGVGGDQWVGGSRSYYAEALAARDWDEFLGCMRSDQKDFGFRTALWWAFRHGFAPLLPVGIKRGLRKTAGIDHAEGNEGRTWLTPAMKRVIQQQRETYRSSFTVSTRRYGQRERYLKLLEPYYMIACELEERLCSSEGLALRRPFQHPNVVQFSFSTPLRLSLQGRLNKFMHRKAMAEFLPQSVLERETKAEFSTVFHRHLLEMKDALTNRIPGRNREWVEWRQVRSKYEQYEDQEDTGWPEGMLWALFGCDALFSTDQF